MSFEQWMSQVDQLLALSLYGLTSSDLADQTYRDWFDSGLEPNDAAAETLRSVSAEFGL